MNKPHNRDDVFPAGIDDGVEREIQQIFVTAQSPGTAEELASEAIRDRRPRLASRVRLGLVQSRPAPRRLPWSVDSPSYR
jgi:hypothetical protein